MTAPEYIQLKAFARIDGALLSLLWIASFALYIVGITSPAFGLASILLAVATPFFVGIRLRHFRDDGLEGTISFLRGWAYTILVFFYGGLLFALVQWAYLTFMDHGYLLTSITDALNSPETMEALTQMNMADTIDESIAMLQQMRPIDLSLNMLTTNIMIGTILGLPIAAILQRKNSGTAKQ